MDNDLFSEIKRDCCDYSWWSLKLSCKVSSETVALRDNNPFNVRLEYGNLAIIFLDNHLKMFQQIV